MPRSRVGYLISCVHNSDIKLMRHQVRDQTTYGAWGFLSIPVPSEIGARQTRALVTRYPKFSTQNALHGSRLLRGVVLDFPRFSCSTIVGSVPLPVHMKRLKKEKKKKRLESSGYHNSRNVYMVWLPPLPCFESSFRLYPHSCIWKGISTSFSVDSIAPVPFPSAHRTIAPDLLHLI